MDQTPKQSTPWLLIILLIVIVLLLIGGGFFAWRYFALKKTTASPKPSPTKSVAVTPSAAASVSKSAPSTNPAADSSEQTPATSNPTAETNPTAAPTTNSNSSSSGETAAIVAACQSAHPGLTCQVSKVDGNYAMGTASSTGGGAGWYAKKVGGTWTLVVPATQDDPPCSATADFPKSIVPSCL